MNEPARPGSSGIWHAALLYSSTAEFEAAAREFAEDAARAGAAVLVACTGPPLTQLREQLNGLGEHITWADIGDMGKNPGRLIHVISRFAAQHPGQPAWCLQEAAWPSRPAPELLEVIRHEALINHALTGPMRILCPYHASLPTDMISCAQAAHPLTGRHNGQWRPSARYRYQPGTPLIPPECDEPLPPPPAGARTLHYRHDLASARNLVPACAQEAGLPPHRASDLLMAVGELTANTLVHTSGPGALTIWSTQTEVTCQVSDTGHITDPLAGQLRPSPAAEGGGRGLWLVHQLCDLVQIRTSAAGTTIRAHMRLLTHDLPDERQDLAARARAIAGCWRRCSSRSAAGSHSW